MSQEDAITGGCTDLYRHPEVPVVSFASNVLAEASTPNESNEPDDRLEPAWTTRSSAATTCASETDEEDYETPSEGFFPTKRSCTEVHGASKESLCGYIRKKSTSLSKLAALDRIESPIKEEVKLDPRYELMENRLTQKTAYIQRAGFILPQSSVKSKSLPILKSEAPSDVSINFKATDLALTSASSFAREKKMSMIVERMASLFRSYPSTVSVTTGSTTKLQDHQYEAKRFESKTMLPVFDDAVPTVINDERSEELVTEATLNERFETKNNPRTIDRDSCRDATPTFLNDEGATNPANDGDLVDVARNPYSSIGSVYFPPNLPDSPALPDDSSGSKKHPRIITDVEALLKIDHELSPLRCQYSEIIGKTRALGLNSSDFDLGISCRADQRDRVDQSVPSSNVSGHFLDRDETPRRRRAATSCSFKGRAALVGKTSQPSPTFSVVGKPTAIGSPGCASWLNENGSSRRQKALDFAIRDSFRALDRFDSLRSPSLLRNNASYLLPTTSVHPSQGGNAPGVFRERSCNECVSDNHFQHYRKLDTAIEGGTRARKGWSAHNRFNPSLYRTESITHHSYLDQNSRLPRNSFLEMQRQASSVSGISFGQLHDWNASRTTCQSNYSSRSTIMQVIPGIDDTWGTVGEETTSKRSSEQHLGVFLNDQHSTATQVKFASPGSDRYKSTLTETEYVLGNNRIGSFGSSHFRLDSIDRGVGPDRQILRATSTATCAPQIRVVSVNTEFHATVEKRYTSRAVSPIRDSCSKNAANASLTTSSSNVLLATVSSVFVRQVRADSSTEVSRFHSPLEICVGNKRKNVVSDTRKIDSQSRDIEDLSRIPPEFAEKKVDSTAIISKKTQHLHLPTATERITIVPVVFTDGIPEPPKTADVDFALSRYIDVVAPRSSCHVVPYKTERSRRIRSSLNKDNGASSACLIEEESTNEEPGNRTSVSCAADRNGLEEDVDRASWTKRNAKRSIRVAKADEVGSCREREYPDGPAKTVTKAIPGMRSSPEDFLCDT